MLNLKSEILVLLVVFNFFFATSTLLAKDLALDGIRVNHIGKKTRVSFLFNTKVHYSLNYLENPFRVLIDFKGFPVSNFDKVKIFNVGFVKNIRSYFLEKEDKKGVYFVDVCVIELDRKCVVDIFESENTLHADLFDVEEEKRAERENLMKQMQIERADKLYEEGLQFLKEGKFESAKEKFLSAMSVDEVKEKAKDKLKHTKKMIKEKLKAIKKDAARLEKEMSEMLKKEKKLAKKLEKDLFKKREYILSKQIDAKDLEQKGMLSYKSGDYKSALDSWDQLLQLQPRNIKIARYIADARRKLKVHNKINSEDDKIKEQIDDINSRKIIKTPEIIDTKEQVFIRFPINQPFQVRSGALKDPVRIMIYLSESIITDIDNFIDVKKGNVKGIRFYTTKIDKEYLVSNKWNKVDAIIVDLEDFYGYKLAQSDDIFEITINKVKIVEP